MSVVIVYTPFWETLKNSEESTYTLIKKYHISGSTIDRLRKNLSVSTTTLNDLCRILDCPVEAILVYTPSEDDQLL